MTEDECIFLIDTNVLVYAYDTKDLKKHRIAKELLSQCWQNMSKYAVSVQNLSELFSIVTQKIERKLPVEQAEQIISDIINFVNFIKIKFDSKTVLGAIDINKRTKCHYYDCLIAATMIENGIFSIYTENTKDFSRIYGVKAVNPFS